EQYEMAEELMRSTLGIFPGNLRLRHELARARFKKGERSGAIAQVRHTLEEPIRQSVPILLYHGVSEASTREDTMPLRNFRDQMERLRREGYTSIDIHRLLDFYEKGAPLPPKPVFITFDDARADSFRYADPVLREMGFHATMFVPVAEVGQHGPFNAVWETVLEMHRSGRWDIQCHSYLGHRPIPIDQRGTLGAFLANRMWLEDKRRFETREEFVARLDEDYRRCGQALLQKIPSLKLAGYAYPFGEMGQKSFSNEPSAVDVNQRLAVKYYRVGLVQDPAAAVNRRSGAPVLPRFEVPWDFTGDTLVKHLKSIDAHTSTMLLLADLYAWDGRFADANAMFDQVAALPTVDQAELLTRRGRFFMWQGDFHTARSYLDDAERHDPKNRTVQQSVRQLDLRTSPTADAQGLFYSDNRDRTNFSIGPTGDVHLTDRAKLVASYRYKQFADDGFDGLEENGATPEDETDGTGGSQAALGSPVDLKATGNEFEAELAYNLDWRTGFAVSGGVVQFDDRSSQRMFDEGPNPFPLASATVNLGLGDAADARVRAIRSYVGAAGAILDDLGSSGGEAQLEVRPFRPLSIDGRFLFLRYDDGNFRNTGIGRLLQEIWDQPRVRVGYRLTYDDTRDRNPFFYTPEGFVGNEGVIRLELAPVEVLRLSVETGVGVGQERGGDAQPQASVIGNGQLQLAERFGVYAGGGRSQAADFESFQITGGLSVTF
ncbi:MAG: polysaccharide deacetylase family protein, partial [Candidatus Binatia bacterium]